MAISSKERRRSERKGVLEDFQVFITIASQGPQRIYLKDISEHGLGVIKGQLQAAKLGDEFDCNFHINNNLKLPMRLIVRRIENEIIGCEFIDFNSKAHSAFVKFVNLLDDLANFYSENNKG